jgi:hypothetical protein
VDVSFVETDAKALFRSAFSSLSIIVRPFDMSLVFLEEVFEVIILGLIVGFYLFYKA